MATIFHLEAADVIEMVAAADVAPNDFVDVGGKLGVALNGGTTGDKISVKLNGAVNANKPAEAHVFGDVLTANAAPTNTVAAAGGAILACATVLADSGSGEATVLVKLN